MITTGVTAPVPRAGQAAGSRPVEGVAATLMEVAGIRAPGTGGQGAVPPEMAGLRTLARLAQMQALAQASGGGARVMAVLAHPDAPPEAPAARAETMAAAVLARAADAPPAAGAEARAPVLAPEQLPPALVATEAAQRYAAALLVAQGLAGEGAQRLHPSHKAGRKAEKAGRLPPFDSDTEEEEEGWTGYDAPPQAAPYDPLPQDPARHYGATIESGARPGTVAVRISEIISVDPGPAPDAPVRERILLEPGVEVLLQLDSGLEAWQVAREGDRLEVSFTGGTITFDGVAGAGAIGIAVGPVAPIVLLTTPKTIDHAP